MSQRSALTVEDRIWDNGWGKALVYFAELEESLRRANAKQKRRWWFWQ